MKNDYIRRLLERNEIKSRTTNKSYECRLCCPFCPENYGSPDTKFRLYLNFGTRGFHCFRCGTSGPWTDLRRKLGLGGTVQKGSSISDIKDSLEEQKPVKALKRYVPKKLTKVSSEIQEHFGTFQTYHSNLVSYFLSRGFDTDLIDMFHVRYCDRDYFAEEKKERLNFSKRVIIPVIFKNEIVGFIGRAIADWIQPKYLNPHFTKSIYLFNYDRIKNTKRVLVVEGPFDVIGAHPFPSTCLLGTSLSAVQKKLLNGKMLLFGLDPDALKIAIKQAVELVSELSQDNEVRLVRWPAGKDPGDLKYKGIMPYIKKATPITGGLDALVYSLKESR